MSGESHFTLSDIAREAGKEKNRKLLRILSDTSPAIPFDRVGNIRIYDRDGKAELLRRSKEWDERPRLSHMAATA